MTLQARPTGFLQGGVGLVDVLPKIAKELQGLTISVVDGAAAGTKMNIAAMRDEDTIVAALKFADTWAAPADDKANITIQSCKASGTVTLANAVPVDGDTVEVRGVTYTFKTTPTAINHVHIGANINACATNLAAAINAYENQYLGNDGVRTALVTASASTATVTVTAVNEGTGANAYTLAATFDTGANVSVSAATLEGGTATGGIKSTTDLSTATLVVVWHNKQ